MGSTNRSKTAYVAEVTHGLTPASPAFKELRNTSNGLSLVPTRSASAEIRADRQIVDYPLLDLNNNGAIGIELSFGSHDDMIEAAFQGTWTNKPSITVVTSDTEISDVSTTTVTVASAQNAAQFKTGHIASLAGFTTAGNNKIARVASSTATTIVFPAATFTAEGAAIPVGASIRVAGFMGATGDITATATGISSSALDFTTLGLTVGEWHKFGGDIAGTQFTTAANNSWARLSAIAAHALTYDILPASWSAEADTTKTIQVFTGDFLINGIIQRSFTIERQQQDLTLPSYEYFLGDQVDGISLTLKANTIITGSINFMGLSATVGTSRTSGASDVAANTNLVLNSASNVGRLAIGGTTVAGPSFVTELGFDLKNNIGRETSVGSLYATGLRDGEIALTGNLVTYFGDITYLGYVLNDNVVSVNFRCGRTDGNRQSLLIDVPAIKVTGDSKVAAKNQSRMFNGSYSAFRHPTLGYTVSAGRFWYLPVATG